MKSFNSLNCSLCSLPFDRIANQPRSPRDLYCGKAICDTCFTKETTQKEQRHACKFGDKCFEKPEFAHFLIAILSQDSLKLSPEGDGYSLCKPFKCPICHDEYANNPRGKSPFYLRSCEHFICTSCFEKTRNLNEKPNKNHWKYEIKCPVCSKVTITNGNGRDWSRTQLGDFLNELPEMGLQWEEVSTTTYREESKNEQPSEDMFYCEKGHKNLYQHDPDFQKNECDTEAKDLSKSLDGNEDDDKLIVYELKSNYCALIYFAIGWLLLFMLFYLRIVNNRT